MSDIAKFTLLIVGALAYFVLLPFLVWTHPSAPLWIKIGMTVFQIVGVIAMAD